MGSDLKKNKKKWGSRLHSSLGVKNEDATPIFSSNETIYFGSKLTGLTISNSNGARLSSLPEFLRLDIPFLVMI
jgi:hypothetical protein